MARSKIIQEIAPYSADVLDPFVLKRQMTVYDKIKVAVLTVTVLPLRIIVMFILLVFAWILGMYSLRGLSKEEMRKKPITGWRRYYMKPFIVLIARLMFVVGGWNWIKTKGKRASAKEAPILLLVPHTSFLDSIPVIALGCPCLVVKDSTETTPLFGDLVNYTQPIYVRRDDPMSRLHTIDEIRRRCRSGDDWEQVLIFPEGTCGNRKGLLSFKLGAFYPGVPIQPVFIRYPNQLDTITWTWDGPGALKQLWLSMTQFHIYCELEFLPVYNPTKAEMENPRLFANNVRKSISEATGTPVSNFSLDDVKYLHLATKQKLPRTVGLVKLLKLRRKIGYEIVDVTDELTNLTKKLESQEIFCNLNDFGRYLSTHVSEALKDFFYLVDQEGKGKIDIRIYNAGLWLLKSSLGEWERLENAFQVFSKETRIDLNQFAAIALLWRGIPITIARDIFQLLTFTSKEKEFVSFSKFKTFAIRYAHLEEDIKRFEKKQQNGSVFSCRLPLNNKNSKLS